MGDGKKRVATQAGVVTYGSPIGTIITADMETKAQNKSQGKPEPGKWKPGQAKPGSMATPAHSATGKSNTQVAADQQLKISKVLTHEKAPGAKAYVFSDSTAVFEDVKGVRSKRAQVDVDELDQLGWKVTHTAKK